MSEDLKTIIPETKIVKANPLGKGLEASKVIEHDILFKAKDGSYHQTPEGLERANETHFQRFQRFHKKK